MYVCKCREHLCEDDAQGRGGVHYFLELPLLAEAAHQLAELHHTGGIAGHT